jgi:hypothetical protein
MSIDKIIKGDSKSFKVKIDTVSGPLNLGGYASCVMYLYEDDDFSSPIVTWDSSDAKRAIFFDRTNGIIQFFIVSSDTSNLEAKQYPYRMKIVKDSDHVYTIHQGILEITD